MLFVGRESRGGARVLPGGASLPYRSIGLLKKKFAEILEILEIFGNLADTDGAVGGAFCYATNRALPARHQYGLQIAERRGKILGELSIAGSILTTIAQMTDTETVMNLLRKVPLFASLKDEEKVCIEETEEWRLPAGEMLVEEGKHAEYFFVLLEGEISVWKKHADQEIVVYRARSGAFFGEVPLLLGTPYLLSARAECDCRLIVFPEEAFWKLLRLCPAISGEIFRAMVTRLRNIEDFQATAGKAGCPRHNVRRSCP